jgi:hypothetical protein
VLGVAGLAVYIELVGGAVLWIRFHEAGIPEVQSIEALAPDYLFIVGVSALVVPLLIGLLAALAQYALAPANRPGAVPRGFCPLLVMMVLVAAFFAFFVVDGLNFWTKLLLIAIGIIGAIVARMVAKRSIGFVTLGLIFFAFGALYGANFRLVRDLTVTPRFDLAAAIRTESPRPVTGLYLGKTSDEIVIARLTRSLSVELNSWQAVIIPADQIKELRIGPRGQEATLKSQRRARRLGCELNPVNPECRERHKREQEKGKDSRKAGEKGSGAGRSESSGHTGGIEAADSPD